MASMNINHRPERGQAIVLIALAFVVLIAITGLAIDAGYSFADRRRAQNAADNAAFAVALRKIQGSDWHALGLALASNNGFTNDGNNTVDVYEGPHAGCDGTNGPYFGNKEYYQVIIHSTVNTFFSPIIGIRQLHNCVEAITQAKPSVATSLSYGAALAALDCTGTNTILAKGSANITTVGGGAFSNTSDNPAIFVQKSGNLITPANEGLQAVGSITAPPGYPSSTTTGLAQLPCPLPDYMLPKYKCDFNYGDFPPSKTDSHVTVAKDMTTFSPGVYCISGGFTKTTMTGTGVTFVMLNQGFKWNGNEQIHLSAPATGPTKGLLVYLPYGNKGPVWFNGTADTFFTGSLFAPDADLVLLGDFGTNTHGQFVAGTIDMSGNSAGTITFNADENYTFPSLPVIVLAK
jgi:hypothetical protein